MRRYWCYIVLTFPAFLFSTPVTIKAEVLSTVTNPSNGKTYKLISRNTWTDAEAEAQSLGGHLVTINSAAENAFIVANVVLPYHSSDPMWIGLYDPIRNDGGGPGSSHAANFVWAGGQAVEYTNWFPANEPNNYENAEYWVALNWHAQFGESGDHGVWDDLPNAGIGYAVNNGYLGIIEIVPEPSCLGVLALGAIPFLARRGKSGSIPRFQKIQ